MSCYRGPKAQNPGCCNRSMSRHIAACQGCPTNCRSRWWCTAVVTAAVDVVVVAGDTFVVVVVVIAADAVVVVFAALVVVDEEQDANTSDVTMRTVSTIQITPLFI